MKRVLFDIAALIARVVTGVIFLAHGLEKWQGGLGPTSRGFTDMGIPVPELSAVYATIVETVGGLFLIIGLLVRLMGVLLLINMLGAIAFVHASQGVLAGNDGWELPGALGALGLMFAALGGGRIGLDGIIGALFRRHSERHAAEAELAAHASRNGNFATGPTRPQDPPGASKQPKQQAPPRSSRLNDDDMRDIDALVADEPHQHPKPPNR
ncbi:DoxX family protein [Nonomuraea purpurea]|uniref:DoxX family protein n=1 Tax=Nonomuraea purpurea TaxID=1849276 RepID=A0ABV8GD06_9ACTN